ncbi:alanine--glyoxylate aminotransferase family protein [Natroniella sulfidigena]|uniref:pyridoxal-phosphate-dependent aminotransferase family protein n=1 Tax=Natroniella sulfidigena TaxID=723921 RepID=UPI00200A8B17|nr:alanine--glyoxylate aminotransferase family protein [Natroniella sulfidigena]MCK8817107.1 alanine--glyoxylate aminotransferase family protein [Natroniella sulfidigena]
MKNKRTMMLPGPVDVSQHALLSSAQRMIGHRTKECEELIAEVTQGLKYVFQTEHDVLTLTCSGTGGLEASIANTLSRGDKVLSLCTGAFGERYATIAERYGIEVERINFEWGEAVDISKVEEKLEGTDQFKAILMTHNETSTGVINHPKPIGRLAQEHNLLLLVDAVSSLGGIELKVDDWKADIVVTSSQKALMSPPGVSLVSVSPKAFEAIESSDLPKFYWDFRRAKKFLVERPNQTPATPAISTLRALQEALREIRNEGLENVFKRHEVMTMAFRQAMEELGLELLVNDKVASKTVTAVKLPSKVKFERLKERLLKEYNVYITGSKGKLKGRVFRVGHMGNVSRDDILSTISALELVLKNEGLDIELGSGVKAAQQVFYKEGSN